MNYELQVDWDSTLIDLWFTDIDNTVVKGLVKSAVKITTGAPTATAGKFMPGAVIYNAIDGTMWLNTGSTASVVWSIVESSGDLPVETIAFNSDATAGPSVIPAASIVNAILSRDGGATNRSDTTDTATAMLALLPGVIVGATFRFFYKNASTTDGELITLAGGVGVTISGNANVVAGRVQEYIARVTNVGTPAVTLYAVNSVAGVLSQTFTASTVNTLNVVSGAATDSPILKPVGSDTDIGLNLTPKGAGKISTQGPATNKSVSNYIATESGANNAIVGALLDADGTAVPLTAGLEVIVKLAHTLQAGANTFNFNGGGALAINSSRNVANNIGTAYAATGVIRLLYTGAVWVDMSQ